MTYECRVPEQPVSIDQNLEGHNKLDEQDLKLAESKASIEYKSSFHSSLVNSHDLGVLHLSNCDGELRLQLYDHSR